jgi:hypothetical protein
MIFASLNEEFSNLFGRSAQARIALWFDEKREFERLLPAFEKYLAARASPPFTLLRYDEQAAHGQLWLKHQIHWATRDLPAVEREARRHVLYLPFAAERLDGPEDEGGFAADFLLEYRYLGATWLVDGKKPTLFAFLRRAGIKLPSDPREQRALWEGGHDSLLAKFTARFADRDARFWEHALTPAWARQQVIGDLDQTLFDLAAEPAERFRQLVQDGLIGELERQVQDTFGFSRPLPPSDHPAAGNASSSIEEWLADLVLRLALTETYEAYGEPSDFPFASLLPEAPYRARCVQLLKRWLKDGSAAGDYHRLIRRVEGEIDLSSWARSRAGISFAFPHLVRLRFQVFYDQFRDAAKHKTRYLPLLREHAPDLAAAAELTRASPEPLRGFELLHRLAQLATACEEALAKVRAGASAKELASLYLDYAGRIDRAHWRLVADAGRETDLEEVATVANRAYGEYLTGLNSAFFEALRSADTWAVAGMRPIAEEVRDLWGGRRPLAVVIVDALRYDCALDIRERLRLPESALVPALASIPTRTWVGMTALLPLDDDALRYEPGPGEGRLRHAKTGANFSDRQTRLQWLRERAGATCLNVEEIETASRPPRPLPELLCVFGHETIDSLGHDNASDLIRHLHVEVDRLVQLIGKLHQWGYPDVHVLTDHGFVMTSGEVEPPLVAMPAGRALVAKARYALLPAGAVVEAKTFPFPFDPTVRVAFPPGMACFRPEKSFTHGGIAAQEVIIPHLRSRREAAPERVRVRVLPASFEIKTHAVKVAIEAVPPERPDLFSRPVGRTVEVDLRRQAASVLARPVRKEVSPDPDQKVTVVLMLDDRLTFQAGDLLDLVVRDSDTQEVLSPAGLRLTVARSL